MIDANGLVNAMIAWYVDRGGPRDATASDLLIHAASLAWDDDDLEQVTRRIGDQIEDVLAAKAD